MVVEEREKKEYVSNYFGQLFRSSIHENMEDRMQQLLAAVQSGVTDEMNSLLTAEFSDGEIKAAPEGIGDLKEPGPDGMPSLFFKEYWDIVVEKLTQEVHHVLGG